MVSFDEAERFFEKLSPSPISLDESRCVRVRNRNASCTLCQKVCPVQAINTNNNHLTLDLEACLACGSCASVCPTQALSSAVLPHDKWHRLFSELQSLPKQQHQPEALDGKRKDKNDPVHLKPESTPLKKDSKNKQQPPIHEQGFWVCCQEHPLAQDHFDNLLVIPCLAHLDEGHYLISAHYNIPLYALHNRCEQCPKASAHTTINATNQSALNLAHHWNLPITWQLIEEQDMDETRYPLHLDRGGYSRRGLVGSFVSSLKRLSVDAAEITLEVKDNPDSKKPTLAELLTQAPGKLKTFFPKRTALLADVLYEAQRQNTLVENDATPNKEPIETRFWATLTIDSTCQNCGSCAQFCPTGALNHLESSTQHKNTSAAQESLKSDSPEQIPLTFSHSLIQKENNNPGPNHEFRCSDCIQCHLCEDICPQRAIHLSRKITSPQLFSLEPQTIKRPDC